MLPVTSGAKIHAIQGMAPAKIGWGQVTGSAMNTERLVSRGYTNVEKSLAANYDPRVVPLRETGKATMSDDAPASDLSGIGGAATMRIWNDVRAMRSRHTPCGPLVFYMRRFGNVILLHCSGSPLPQ